MSPHPPQLPGMRWDHDRQRYFPISARTFPRPPPPPPSPVPTSRHDLRSVIRTAQKDACIHQILSSQISLTDKVTRSVVPSQGPLSAFQTVSHGGRVWNFAGDSLGWFYSSIVDKDLEEMDTWQPQFYLGSEISSIGVSGTTCVATSFGPDSRILYVPMDSPVQGIHTTRIDSRVVHDVWTADLHGSRLVLGANKQAVMIEDIALCASLQRLPTHSDVLALAQRDNILYTGLRNGSILRFDTRVQRSHIYPLFDQPTSSVTSLKHIHDHQLLVSFIDGGISTFDLRFPIRTPSQTFTGNFNSYTVRLPLVTDPYENFLFAAGQDNRIRLWSLITGGPALDPGGTGSTDQTVFQRPLEHRIAALQVVEEGGRMCLWAASGSELCKYSLGHRSGIGI